MERESRKRGRYRGGDEFFHRRSDNGAYPARQPLKDSLDLLKPVSQTPYSSRHDASTAASQARRGIWAGEFVKPWEWRRGKRLETTAPEACNACGRRRGAASALGGRGGARTGRVSSPRRHLDTGQWRHQYLSCKIGFKCLAVFAAFAHD